MITRDDVIKATQVKHSVIKNVPIRVFSNFSQVENYRHGDEIDNGDEVSWMAFRDCVIHMPNASRLSHQVKPGEIWYCDLSYVGMYGYWTYTFYAHPRKLKVSE